MAADGAGNFEAQLENVVRPSVAVRRIVMREEGEITSEGIRMRNQAAEGTANLGRVCKLKTECLSIEGG